MRREPDAQIKIAGGGAADAMLPLAGHPDARAVGDTGRNADIDRSRVAVVLHRQASSGAVVRLLERQLHFVLHVAAGPLTCTSGAGTPAGARIAESAAAPAEERREEVGERVLVPEDLLHLLLRHRAD